MIRAAATLGLAAVVLCGACGGAEFGTVGSGGASGSSGASAVGGGAAAGTAGSQSSAGKSSGGGGGVASGGGASGAAGNGAGGLIVQPIAGQSGIAGDDGAGGADDMPPPNECPCAAPRPTCQAGRCVVVGPGMIKVGSFYVDSTEVTTEQYAQFLAAKGEDTSGQTKECAWNDSYEPAEKNQSPKYPVTHVDFCDASAYCAWADKQLCGKVGGGSLAFQDLASPTKSQWFAACGGSKGQPYPYGSSFEAGSCNSSTNALANVGSHTGCEGFPDGVFDMVGNVAEWLNACDANNGADDGCETIGGGYTQNGTCSLSSLKHRNEQLPTVGFRCCSQ